MPQLPKFFKMACALDLRFFTSARWNSLSPTAAPRILMFLVVFHAQPGKQEASAKLSEPALSVQMHLCVYVDNPMDPNSELKASQNHATASSVPATNMSSKYATLKSKIPGHSAGTRSFTRPTARWRAKLKSNGPKGSPC